MRASLGFVTSHAPSVSPTPTQSTPVSFDWETYFYLIAQLVGGVGLSVLLVTLVWPSSKRRPRNPLLISLCFSWWLSAFPCLCVLYYANQVVGSPPSPTVCLASASLTMAQSIMVAFTGPALILHIFLVVRTAISSKLASDIWIRRTIVVCLILPYTLFILTALAALWLGFKRPDLIYRVKFYCVVQDSILTRAVSICGIVFVSCAIVLEAWTVVILYCNRTIIKHLSREGYGLDFPLVLRVCVFGLYVCLGLCLEVFSLFYWTNPISDLFFSTFGIAVFVVFGTQPETWRIWRQAYRRAGGTLSQISVPYQLQPRPSPRYLLPMIPSSHPTSLDHLMAASVHSQRQTSFSQRFPPSSRDSKLTLPAHPIMQPYDHYGQPFHYPPPTSPPAARLSFSHSRDCKTMPMAGSSTPSLTNGSQRTPTSPHFPNPGLSLPDHTKGLGVLGPNRATHSQHKTVPRRVQRHKAQHAPHPSNQRCPHACSRRSCPDINGNGAPFQMVPRK